MQGLLTVLQILTGVLVVILVLLQDGKEGANLVATEANNRGSSMGSSNETRLANATKYVGLAFIILTIAVSSIMAINA